MSNEYASRSIGRLLGYHPEKNRHMGEDLLPTIVHPDDFDLLAGHVGSFQSLANRKQKAWEYWAVRKDGEEVQLRSIEMVFTRGAGGEALRHIGFASGIMSEKNTEMHLKELNGELEQRFLVGAAELE